MSAPLSLLCFELHYFLPSFSHAPCLTLATPPAFLLVRPLYSFGHAPCLPLATPLPSFTHAPAFL